ncbi:MAG: hypothetical protein ACHREM_06560 [Polyangiales bacterium]
MTDEATPELTAKAFDELATAEESARPWPSHVNSAHYLYLVRSHQRTLINIARAAVAFVKASKAQSPSEFITEPPCRAAERALVESVRSLLDTNATTPRAADVGLPPMPSELVELLDFLRHVPLERPEQGHRLVMRIWNVRDIFARVDKLHDADGRGLDLTPTLAETEEAIAKLEQALAAARARLREVCGLTKEKAAPANAAPPEPQR